VRLFKKSYLKIININIKMNFLITKKNKIVPASVNFAELVRNKTTIDLSEEYQCKMINELNKEFTEHQQRWYIANFYIYMNYHSTNDYPINLEDVYKMIGFANKGNAKRTLENNFTEDEDYKILSHTQENKTPEKTTVKTCEKEVILPMDKNLFTKDLGGRPTGTIMLNIDTFKSLCMLARTEKGAEIRKYYVKLENIYNKIVKEEIDQLKTLIQKEKENTQKLLKKKDKDHLLNLKEKDKDHLLNLKSSKHNLLLEKFSNKKVVYLSKVQKNFIKVGSSEDINQRKGNLKSIFGNCTFLDVFACNDFREIEQCILQKVKKYLYKYSINGHKSKEVVELTNQEIQNVDQDVELTQEVVELNDCTFNYNQLLTIVKDTIKNYKNKEVEYKTLENESKRLENESKRLENESKRLDLLNKLLDKNLNYDEINVFINGENKIQIVQEPKIQEPKIQEIEIQEPKIQEKRHDTIIERGRKIQAINPDNLNVIVKIYNSMKYAEADTDKDGLKYGKHAIQKAAEKNTIYRNLRWKFVEHGQDPNIVKDVKPTQESRKIEDNMIVQLNNDKSSLIHIYYGITEAREKLNISRLRLYKIIENQTLFNDSYFVKLNDCPKELLENTETPIRTSAKSKSIKVTNIISKKEIIYKSMTEATIEFGSNHKRISNAIKDKKIINGYKIEYT
jgi:phage anti-repressor protein